MLCPSLTNFCTEVPLPFAIQKELRQCCISAETKRDNKSETLTKQSLFS